jgi:hypothetical protein
MSTIFISIISQDEDFLKQTIDSAINNCSPENELHFGVIEQNYSGNFLDYSKYNNISFIQIKCFPRGVGLPRYESMELYNGEDYVLIIDAHNIFDNEWDKKLIKSFKLIQSKEGDNVLISQHLPEATVNDGVVVPIDYRRQSVSKSLYFDGLVIRGYPIFDKEYVEQYAVTCHFIFGMSEAFLDNPFDKRIYYLAEEPVLSALLWTNGYRIFSINYNPMFSLSKPLSSIDNDWRDRVSPDRMANDFSILMDCFYFKNMDKLNKSRIDNFIQLSKIDIACVFKNLNIDVDNNGIELVKAQIKNNFIHNDFNTSVFLNIGKIASASGYTI